MNGMRRVLLCCAIVLGANCAAPITQTESAGAGDMDALRLVKVMADW